MNDSIGPKVIRRFSWIRTSLRARVALGVGLPVLIALGALSWTHYVRERQMLEEQIQLASSQMGELALGGLQHAMMTNNRYMLDQIIEDVGASENVKRFLIVDLNGEVKAASTAEDLGETFQLQSLGCVECHQSPVSSRLKTVRLTESKSTLRISSPIKNDPSCWECHDTDVTHLGMVILDVSLVDAEAHLLEDFRTDLAIAIGSTVLITATVYLLVHRLIVRRVEAFQPPLAQFASGELSSRVPVGSGPTDELGQLALAFNQMADELQEQEREKALRTEVKQRAIREERERISRELHDGMAQVLGYVNTKVTAVRLLLKNKQQESAEEHLIQLEEAARELFVDIREAILGLRMTGQDGNDFAAVIQEYTQQYSRLSNIPVDLKVDSGAEGLRFDPETELQLLRIVQEALTNIRKHASADEAWIALQLDDENITLTVGDDGLGFDQSNDHMDKLTRFGLRTMQERAETVGALFSVDSEPGAGTRVEVVIKRNGE
jgi:signal transduction histidine kinase